VKDGKREQLEELSDISFAIFYARTAVAFQGAQLLSASMIDVPRGIDLRLDPARDLAIRMTSLMADGLKFEGAG
jgi:hypothetical protein